ncbi:aminodeoxychorismate lyase [Agitococcus lubricus]|uniref:Aminodeoxychorismate lyase n=1 Tax=Agitococcus lubricus TaxID=1077255 RepID=A0A2T5IZC5_9GAMM|nr:aminodeoxychorismate lyase [Agitococcus lubricus]PTQ89369.1 aminodeoxychorismate lyase apoprotein [Agitococcus lubricus]
MTLLACWLNGQPIQCLSPLERGFAYGDGLFSTLRVEQAQVPLLDLHWQRLWIGCQRLQLNTDDFAQWQQDFLQFVAQFPQAMAKIIVTRGEGGRGYLPDPQQKTHCYFYAYPLNLHPVANQTGIKTDVLQGRLGINPTLAGLKHVNRLEQVLLRQELALTAYPEGIVLDYFGHVTEGVFSNMFIVRDGQLWTPRLELAGVAGIMREHLCQLAPQLGYAVTEATLGIDDIVNADEAFFCNSVYGIWPIRQIGQHSKADNPITQHLQQQLYYV